MAARDGDSRGHIERQPQEDWRDYMDRLEKARLEAIAGHRLKEAEALESLAEIPKSGQEPLREDVSLRIEARAKRAYAEEFFKAIDEMERGAAS